MWLLLLISCICFVFFDVWYFIRFGITCSFYMLTKSTSLFEESIFYGRTKEFFRQIVNKYVKMENDSKAYFIQDFIHRRRIHNLTGRTKEFFRQIVLKQVRQDGERLICFTTDLDFMIHMNNARYLRDCDFARFKFWIQSKAWKMVQKLGANMSNAGNNIRYRRSLQLFDIYKIKTKLVYWDERSFYLEQQFIRTRDDFVCAVNIVKQTMIGCSPALLIEKLTGEQREPVLTEELKCLLASWQLSSERLRQSS